MKRLALIAIVALVGCSQKPPEPSKPLVWTSLPDGSKATVGEITVPADQFFDGPSAVMRCWPEAGEQDCLVGTRSSYGFMEFIRTKTPNLPTNHRAFVEPPVGYQCVVSVQGGWQESVHSSAGQIKINVVSYIEHPRPDSWSKAEVQKLMTDNAIQPQSHWMNCRNLSEVVGETSLAAVASTEVTREVVGR